MRWRNMLRHDLESRRIAQATSVPVGDRAIPPRRPCRLPVPEAQVRGRRRKGRALYGTVIA